MPNHTKEKELTVGFIGNPNCGKTTLFNAFTGANLKVANWPGVTVERVEGSTVYKGRTLRLIDLPGIYSLTSYSIEEKVSRKCIMEENIDVIVNVVDASSLERNLYLTLQLLEMGKPVILALNMMDIVEERGMEIDLHRRPEMLGGIPVVPVSARKRSGLDVLLHAVLHHYEEGVGGRVVHYETELEEEITRIESDLRAHYGELTHSRWYAIKLLEQDEEIIQYYPKAAVSKEINYEKQIIHQKYNYIDEIMEDTLFHKDSKALATDKVDQLLTHPVWGVPIFLGIMALVFFMTFTVGDFLKGYFEAGLEIFSGAVSSGLLRLGVAEWMRSLLVDGIIAGVGGILTFLPNIFILFLALAFLEDSGYGWDYEHARIVWQGISPNGAWFWMYGSSSYGDESSGKGEGQKKNNIHHAVYVLLGETANLCLICRYVLWKICDACRIFFVSCRSACSYWYCSGA